jgi:hypothetical protein
MERRIVRKRTEVSEKRYLLHIQGRKSAKQETSVLAGGRILGMAAFMASSIEMILR